MSKNRCINCAHCSICGKGSELEGLVPDYYCSEHESYLAEEFATKLKLCEWFESRSDYG